MVYRGVSNQKKEVVEKKVDPVLQKKVLESLDGYSNATAFLGDESKLISSGTYKRSGITNNIELLTVAYRENWVATRIIDMPSEDMIRSWITMSGNFSDDELNELKRQQSYHSVMMELTDAIRWARLYGGSIALMVIRGEDDILDQPLNVDNLYPDCFQGLLVLDRTQGIEPSLELVSDMDDPDFGLPMYYDVDVDYNEIRHVRIHHSRVLRFVGRELPYMEMVRENYWGASELEHVWDELQKRSATSANIAELVFKANITTLKMSDFGESMAMGTEEMKAHIMEMISAENRIRTSYGLQLLSKDDSMENHSYTFAGISDVYEAFMMDLAGAAEIPATKLFGRSPQGFQSTGESDMRNYYEMIAGLQERSLRPALDRLLPVLAMSCWGYLPDDLSFVFNPLATESPDSIAELSQKLSAPVIEAFKAGLIGREEAIAELKARGEKIALWTKLADSSPDPEQSHSNSRNAELIERLKNEILSPDHQVL